MPKKGEGSCKKWVPSNYRGVIDTLTIKSLMNKLMNE